MIINKNIVDMRAEPCFHSERVSQALYNTTCTIVDEANSDWVEIETPDGYRGWVARRHLSESPIADGPEWKVKSDFAPVRALATGEPITRFVFDTRFHAQEKGNDLVFTLPDGILAKISKRSCKPAKKEPLQRIGRLAKRFLGVPYLWGGVSPFGFDCSGYVQRLFHYCGLQVPRDADQQRKFGKQVTSVQELEPGDLAFFPGHVGLYLGDGLLIHANLHYNGVAISDLYDDRDSYNRFLRGNFTEGRRVKNKADSTRKRNFCH